MLMLRRINFHLTESVNIYIFVDIAYRPNKLNKYIYILYEKDLSCIPVSSI
jgi:hypothetical protein